MDPEVDFPEHDRAVRNWFTVRLWPVTDAFGYFDAEIYAWRYRGLHGQFTLHVTREVLERNDARVFPERLEERDAETALRESANGDAILRYVGGQLILGHFSPRSGE